MPNVHKDRQVSHLEEAAESIIVPITSGRHNHRLSQHQELTF
jgi:hypothetical protein